MRSKNFSHNCIAGFLTVLVRPISIDVVDRLDHGIPAAPPPSACRQHKQRRLRRQYEQLGIVLLRGCPRAPYHLGWKQYQ